jgi:uncharacterized protein (TIGR02145 family)
MKKRLGFFLLMILLLIGLSFCSKEEPISGNQVYIGLPLFLTTDDVNSITCVCARSGGHIIENEGVGESAVLTTLGVCWSTTPNPTIADYKMIVDLDIGIHPDPKHFHSVLTGLNSVTTYYVRAYLTTSAGTAYGNEISFTTPASTAPVSDIDGNVYKTIQIGTQTWMAENLKTTRYNNGDQIPLSKGFPAGYTDWFGLEKGAYCWYDNDELTYKDAYGAIYNWHADGNGKLCPTGWHVPTNSEWTTLITFLGGEEEAFDENRESATIHWGSSNYSIVKSAFTPVPAGLLDGWGFSEGGCCWWSDTPRPDEWNAYLLSFVSKAYGPKSDGYSVRCLKNN